MRFLYDYCRYYATIHLIVAVLVGLCSSRLFENSEKDGQNGKNKKEFLSFNVHTKPGSKNQTSYKIEKEEEEKKRSEEAKTLGKKFANVCF